MTKLTQLLSIFSLALLGCSTESTTTTEAPVALQKKITIVIEKAAALPLYQIAVRITATSEIQGTYYVFGADEFINNRLELVTDVTNSNHEFTIQVNVEPFKGAIDYHSCTGHDNTASETCVITMAPKSPILINGKTFTFPSDQTIPALDTAKLLAGTWNGYGSVSKFNALANQSFVSSYKGQKLIIDTAGWFIQHRPGNDIFWSMAHNGEPSPERINYGIWRVSGDTLRLYTYLCTDYNAVACYGEELPLKQISPEPLFADSLFTRGN